MKIFSKDIGVPEALIIDGSKAETISEVKRFCINIDITLKILEQGAPWANLAELWLVMLKYSVSEDLTESNSHLRLWIYHVEQGDNVYNLTSRDDFKLQILTPRIALTGEQADISYLCQFWWFGWIYYRDDKKNFSEHEEMVWKVLGPSKGIGNEMRQ